MYVCMYVYTHTGTLCWIVDTSPTSWISRQTALLMGRTGRDSCVWLATGSCTVVALVLVATTPMMVCTVFYMHACINNYFYDTVGSF